jgi:hypothetical protein
MPNINLPTIDLSKIKPGVDLPDTEQIIEWARDGVFAGVGLVALTAERVTELQKRVVEAIGARLPR